MIHVMFFIFQAFTSSLAQPGCLLKVGLNGPEPNIDHRFQLSIDAERIVLTRAYFQQHNSELYRKMPANEKLSTIQFEPRIVVVHFTSIPSLEEVVTYFAPNRIASDRGSVTEAAALNVGIQFIVDRDGSIYSSYPENVMSRHTIGLNHVAIGIENVGNADLDESAGGKLGLTPAQLEANLALIRYLAGKYSKLAYLIGHMEYRQLEDPNHPAHALFAEDQPAYRTDKIDPGHRFMTALRKELTLSE